MTIAPPELANAETSFANSFRQSFFSIFLKASQALNSKVGLSGIRFLIRLRMSSSVQSFISLFMTLLREDPFNKGLGGGMLLHQFNKILEVMCRIVRAGSGFRMVLH